MASKRRARIFPFLWYTKEAERAALAHWDGLGAVRLLQGPVTEGALLLERLHPDVSVRSLPEAKALLEPAAAGLDLICRGLQRVSPDDRTALERGALVYEALYAQLAAEQS